MSLSLAENVIVVGDDNRPLMMDKSNNSSWASHMLLCIKGKPNGKFLVDYVLNGPFYFGTIREPKTENTPAMVRPQTYTDLTDEEKLCESVDITAKNIFLQGSKLSLQERESKLYDDFDMFTSTPGETIHSYYMRFAQLFKYMHTIGMTMKPMQHEAHANEVRLTRQRYPDQIALVANSPSCLNPTQYYPQLSSASQQYYPSPAP
ncbi:hypothetical protein Tco_0290038 [Tanacetum coccineum]